MIQIKKLKNNITVIYESMDYLRAVSFGIYVKIGSAAENRDNNGISHVIEHMLFKGTQYKSAKDLADIMSDLGGNINAYTAKEHTSYYGSVLNEDFECAMELLGDMIVNPAFGRKELAREKHVILDEIDMYDDSAEDLCHELLQKKVWNDSPYGYIISGNRTNVRKFSREDVVKAWEESYVAENIVISIAGGIKEKQAFDILEKYFGNIRCGGIKTEFATPEYKRCFLAKYKDTEQMHINMAFDCVSSVSEERYAISIINAYLGGNLNSRLFQKVREELGLTYTIYSYISMFEKAGLFHIYATTGPAQADKCVDAIKDVVVNMVEDSINEKEIETIKRQMKTEIILSGESSGQRMSSNAKSYMNTMTIETMDETIENINKVSIEKIKSCLNKYFDLSQSSISLVGDIDSAHISKIKTKWN